MHHPNYVILYLSPKSLNKSPSKTRASKPGELEFSDQEEFGFDGPSEIRVAPPPGFRDDLALIGSKFDPSDPMEKEHNPELAELKNTQELNAAANAPALQSSFPQNLLQQQQQANSAFNPFALAGLLGIKQNPDRTFVTILEPVNPPMDIFKLQKKSMID